MKIAMPTTQSSSLPVGKDAHDQEAIPLLKGGGDGSDCEVQQTRHPVPTILGIPSVIVAGACHVMSSSSIVLLNKYALSNFGFTAPNALLFFQCALTVALLKACEAGGLIKPLQPLKRDLMAIWFPVNLLFVSMVGSSFWSLQLLGVAVITVFKNLTNLMTAMGDVFIYGKRFAWPVWAALALMLGSAVLGAQSDVRFHWIGFGFQMFNCLVTSAYTLYLRSVMDKVAAHTVDKQRMDEFSMMYYNNVLSLPCILVLMAMFGEFGRLGSQPALSNPSFIMVAGLGGFMGFAISFTSLWFLSQVSATTYGLVGALNKAPVVIVGLLVFGEPTSAKNMTSIVVALLSGVIFAQAKQLKPQGKHAGA